MAEQERKFEEQERRLAEASRPDRNEYQRSDGRDAEQEQVSLLSPRLWGDF